MEEGLEWANSRPERKGKSPLRRYSFSRDDEPFNKLVGSDNGYSYAKMMQENKRYEDYEADYLDVSMDPAPAMGMGYRRRRH